MNVVIIFTPENLKLDAIARYSFTYEKHVVPATDKTREQIQLDSVMLLPGTNFVDADIWAKVEQHTTNISQLDSMKKRNGLVVHVPDSDNHNGKTLDYEDMGIVRDIVEGCNDLRWLQQCFSDERRDPVLTMLGDRIEEVENERKRRKDRSVAVMA
jgi:hypothetical protein